MICYIIMEPLAGAIGAGLVGTIYLYSGHLVATGVQIQGKDKKPSLILICI
jgi:hypothetical protein